MLTSSNPQFLDHYCERIAPGFWGEPFNLLSNIAFIIAGILVWRVLLQHRNYISCRVWDIGLLIILLFAIGIGSGLWHIYANSWSLKADYIPILLFINIYLLSSIFRLFSLSAIAGISIFFVYHVVNSSVQAALPADFLNGSIFYLPTWLFLMGITYFAWQLKLSEYRRYVYALFIFTFSLAFRTMDQSICDTIPIGTHFIWHLFIAATLYLLMLGLISNTAKDLRQPQT